MIDLSEEEVKYNIDTTAKYVMIHDLRRTHG